ncbi:MAG: cyclic nucleotide-binding domain-containing protein [Candidatus Roizmanbacteria bacterium]|nr:cyclic nucleotide-binding domain-containing protein [Candidatus Roizmanbacteria bacterium]
MNVRIGLAEEISTGCVDQPISDLKQLIRPTVDSLVVMHPGDILYTINDPPTNLYLVESGRVSLTRVTDNGEYQVLAVVGTGNPSHILGGYHILGDASPMTEGDWSGLVPHVFGEMGPFPARIWQIGSRQTTLLKQETHLSRQLLFGEITLMKQIQYQHSTLIPYDEYRNNVGTKNEKLRIEITRHIAETIYFLCGNCQKDCLISTPEIKAASRLSNRTSAVTTWINNLLAEKCPITLLHGRLIANRDSLRKWLSLYGSEEILKIDTIWE